jgi:hypothetical protein
MLSDQKKGALKIVFESIAELGKTRGWYGELWTTYIEVACEARQTHTIY